MELIPTNAPVASERCAARGGRRSGIRAVAALLVFASAPLLSDTVYQERATGQPRAILQDCVVISNDASFVACKHFDLKRHRVVVVRFEQEASPYTVSFSSAASREAIVATWKTFGFTATVVENTGRKTVVYDSYLDFFPVANTFFTETVPPQTSFPIKLDQGGTDFIEFSKILKIQFRAPKMEVFLRNGRIEKGEFLMPTTQPATAHFMGLTDHYVPTSQQVFDFSVPLSQIKEIDFQ